ncbi:MAG: exodeoxyribonuclease VII small subunit [Planctomycetia bacterium]|nr:exodeoxyribonuclease VII small subunit [Planctomycetia bacterium]
MEKKVKQEKSVSPGDVGEVETLKFSGESMNPGSFEESFSRLKMVVRKLEERQVPLDESLVLYEEGIHLVRVCHEKLVSARKRKVEIIAGLGADGSILMKPMEEDERSLEEKASTRGR